MAQNKVKVLILLAGQDEPIRAEIDMGNKHDLDNWMMGRRHLKIFVVRPGSKSALPMYDTECRLGPNLGLTAQIMFLE